jgi:surfactin synthase thioesterase subunit
MEESFLKRYFPHYDGKCVESGFGTFFSFESMIAQACYRLNKEIDHLKSGFTLFGISQGALIARAII